MKSMSCTEWNANQKKNIAVLYLS